MAEWTRSVLPALVAALPLVLGACGSGSRTTPGTIAAGATSTPATSSASITIGPTALVAGAVGQAYAASLTASGGTAPYSWTLTAGALPSGLTFNSGTGQISGTPTTSGTFAVTASVTDADANVAQQPYTLSVAGGSTDAYGGITAVACPGGAAPHFYTAQIGSRWHLCTPAGNVFWMNGVYDVDATDSTPDNEGVALASLVASKYATGATSTPTLNWSLESVRRLQSWGFNTLAEYAVAWTWPVGVSSSWGTPDNTIPVKLPFVAFAAPSLYSLTNSSGYAQQPVKDLIVGVKSSVYSGYRSQTPDVWDPDWALWLKNDLANDSWMQQAIHGPNNGYLVGINVDDTDYLEGYGAGSDFPTVANGAIAQGYAQPNLAWIVLVTAPTQTSNASLNETYSDTTVYSKAVLAQWLASRYGNSITALDAAWGASYTSFGSSGGWGVGTGLLDEDGTCPAAQGAACWVPSDAYQLSGATTAMQQDLNGFLLYDAQQYFSTIKAALQAAAPGVLYLGPTSLGTWGAPPRAQILQAAASSVDVVMLASMPPDCSNCTDLQQRLDFVNQNVGNKPWVNWEGYPANADSYESAAATPTDEFKTQAARAAMYQTRLQLLYNSADSGGTHHFVGLKWWAMYDSPGQQTNWGLVTPRDDPYDGKSATPTAGVDAWGYPTGCVPGFGCEQAAYGDFLDVVTAANLALMVQLASGQ